MVTQLLVIEDERQIRENVAELLSLNGFTVDTAGDGREGILRAMLSRPDLILCDVMMPKMDGYQVLEIIRSNRSLANVPFIFLTAKADITDMRRGMALGADDYLTKPFTSADLLAAIQSRLQREQIRDATVQAQFEKYRNELSRVSGHEYNTPLTGIMGFANLLTDYYDTFDKTETLSMLGMITTCCLRLKRTLDNVRLTDALLQPHNGQFTYSSQSTDCPLVGNSLIEQIQLDLSRRHEQVINCHTDVTSARLAISGENLTKILEELLDNAFKFSPPRSKISLIGRPHEEGYQFTIINHGRVFSAENVAKIAPYVQFDRDVYEQQGSGLGLFIAKRLTELNHGHLSIQSQTDGRTNVTVQLPVLNTTLTTGNGETAGVTIS